MGFPTITGERSGYKPMDTFPIEGDALPKGYNGWLLFLDEFNSAPQAVQAAAYKLVLDRMIGSYRLHSKVAIVCAGNLDTDNAIVQPMSTALQSRLVHMELCVDVKEWSEWANKSGVHHFITSYVNWKPGNLYNFTPTHTDKTYACPRTWEFADRILKVSEADDPGLLPLLVGTVGEGVAREFMGFIKIHADLPKIPTIIADPTGVKVPDEPSILFALCGAISHNAAEDNFAALMKYVTRLPLEFQVVCLRETMQRTPSMIGTPAAQEWIAKNSKELF